MKLAINIFKYVLLIAIGIVGGISIAGGAKETKEILRKDKTDEIKEILELNCKCESIEQFIYTRAIAMSKEEGFSNEFVEYQLKNCNYEDLYKEASRLNILLSNIKGYEQLDTVQLEFIDSLQHQTITIRNGIIQ